MSKKTLSDDTPEEVQRLLSLPAPRQPIIHTEACQHCGSSFCKVCGGDIALPRMLYERVGICYKCAVAIRKMFAKAHSGEWNK